MPCRYVLRKAFDTPDEPYLPESVLWRQKEQFSDGVGYDWVDSLKVRKRRETKRIHSSRIETQSVTSRVTPATYHLIRFLMCNSDFHRVIPYYICDYP